MHLGTSIYDIRNQVGWGGWVPEKADDISDKLCERDSDKRGGGHKILQMSLIEAPLAKKGATQPNRHHLLVAIWHSRKVDW